MAINFLIVTGYYTKLGEITLDIKSIFKGIADVSVCIVGDVCIDAYYFVSNEKGEISVETGIETRSVERYHVDLGGAANVAVNIKKLGAKNVYLFGIVGDDLFAEVMTNLLGKAGVSERLVVQKRNWSTNVYNKIYAQGLEDPRLDIGNFNKPAEESIDTLLSSLEKILTSCKVVIINEQVASGFQSKYFQEGLQRLIDASGDRLIWMCDCRNLNDMYRNTLHKLNDREASLIYAAYHQGEAAKPAADRGAAADTKTTEDAGKIMWLFEHWKKPVIMTRGADGALVFDGSSLHEIPGLHIINQIDIVGAGDAFLSATAACFAAGASLETAAEIGNFSAGVSVQKLFQTGHPSVEEILEISDSPDYRYHPALAKNSRQAAYLPGTEIEIITRPSPETPTIAIFDHDGTISTLRFGWDGIMESMMTRCILGDTYAEVSEAVFAKVKDAVFNLINRTTGVQTLIQMQGLCRLVSDFGYVELSRILDPADYKAIFNKELLGMVEKRAERIRKGSLSVEDVIIKGSLPFLLRLHDAGVTLYLASGTDVDDVRREAVLLGYENLFNGGIYGSVGDIAHDPKKLVLEQILGDIDRQSGKKARCVVFGDGPVELREACKHGASAIGVISDERQRFGLNLRKRERLVLAGAEVLIPDYSWSNELVDWLKWEI